MRLTIQEIKNSEEIQNIKVGCWVESKKENHLIIKDGSCFQTLSAIINEKNFKDKNSFNLLNNVKKGSAVLLKGNVIKSPIKAKQFEFLVTYGKIISNVEKNIVDDSQNSIPAHLGRSG